MASETPKPIVLPEVLPDPFAPEAIECESFEKLLASMIQRDGQSIGVEFDDDFAQMIADHVIAGLAYDDEVQLDALSSVYDADIRRVLAA